MSDARFENFTRVSDILYPFSGLQHIDPDILMNAANRGTRVHKICEAIASGLGEFDMDAEVMGYVSSFKKWWGDGREIVAMEKRFFCETHELTGQCDFIIKEGDDLIIVDLKTSAKPSKTWRLQGSAYSYLAKKDGYDINKIQFIHLNRDGDEPAVIEYEEDWDFFLSCLKVYNFFYKPTKRK